MFLKFVHRPRERFRNFPFSNFVFGVFDIWNRDVIFFGRNFSSNDKITKQINQRVDSFWFSRYFKELKKLDSKKENVFFVQQRFFSFSDRKIEEICVTSVIGWNYTELWTFRQIGRIEAKKENLNKFVLFSASIFILRFAFENLTMNSIETNSTRWEKMLIESTLFLVVKSWNSSSRSEISV